MLGDEYRCRKTIIMVIYWQNKEEILNAYPSFPHQILQASHVTKKTQHFISHIVLVKRNLLTFLSCELINVSTLMKPEK